MISVVTATSVETNAIAINARFFLVSLWPSAVLLNAKHIFIHIVTIQGPAW